MSARLLSATILGGLAGAGLLAGCSTYGTAGYVEPAPYYYDGQPNSMFFDTPYYYNTWPQYNRPFYSFGGNREFHGHGGRHDGGKFHNGGNFHDGGKFHDGRGPGGPGGKR